MRITSRWLSWLPCDMLRRAMFMPARARLSIFSRVALEGPSVHTILVCRKSRGAMMRTCSFPAAEPGRRLARIGVEADPYIVFERPAAGPGQ